MKKVGRPRGSSNSANKNASRKITTEINKLDGEKLNELHEDPKKEVINELFKLKTNTPVKSGPASLVETHFVSTNYKMEDLILIDEDDDIIGYNEDDDQDIEAELQAQGNGLSQRDVASHGKEGDNDAFNNLLHDEMEADKDEEHSEMDEENEKPKVVIEKVEEVLAKQHKTRTTRSKIKQTKKTATLTVSDSTVPAAEDAKTVGEQVKQLKGVKSLNKNYLKKTNDTFNATSEHVGEDRVRVTRSKSKLITQTNPHSPASSTSSNNK